MLAGFGLWVLVLFRGVQNFLTWKNMWSTPAWLFYGCSVMVFFLFFTINMTPKTNTQIEELAEEGAVCVSGIGYFGGVAVSEVPPLVDFVFENGRTIFTADMITRGGKVFHLRGLLSSGSFLGDGSERGPDCTAEALHVMAVGIVQHYQSQMPKSATEFMLQAA